jgi:DNA-binding CsgD family transcriptional regulator
MIGSVDHRGFITQIEATGAALSVEVKDEAQARAEIAYIRPAATMAGSRGLEVLRNSFRMGDWIGWSAGIGRGEAVFFSALQLGLMRRAESPVWQRWAGQMPAGGLMAGGGMSAGGSNGHGATVHGWQDVFAGLAMIPGGDADASGSRRVVLAEVAIGPGSAMEASRAQAVMEASLPLLASRILRAIGPQATAKNDWLTPREEMVLWHLLSGKKVPEIAKELDRSVYTVHDHVKSLHRKLGANNRGQLVARALGHLGPLPADAIASVEGAMMMEGEQGTNGHANGHSNGHASSQGRNGTGKHDKSGH